MSASSDTPSTATNTAVVSSGWRSKLPFRVRSRPRAYGTGRYGIDHYDNRDDSRYAWNRVVPAITAFVLVVMLALPARAANLYCEATDGTTSSLGLCKPSVDVEGANAWGDKWNSNADIIEVAVSSLSIAVTAIANATSSFSTSFTTQKLYVKQIAGLAGGIYVSSPTTFDSTVTISGADQNNDRLRFFNQGGTSDWSWVGGIPALSNSGMCLYDNNAASCRLRLLDSSGNVGIGTNTPAQKLDVAGGAQIGTGVAATTFTNTGAVIAYSSITASAFFGDGSHLSGVDTSTVFSDATFAVYSSTDATKKWAFDASGQATGITTTLGSLNQTNKTVYIQPLVDSSGTFVVANGATGQVFIGTNVALGGSNSGIQYASMIANRAQIRNIAFGNHTGVSGMTCGKSRGAFIGDNVSVNVGDSACRTTVQMGAATAGSFPISADTSYIAAQVNALSVAADMQWRLTNDAGTLGQRMYLTSEGALSTLLGYTGSSVTLSGNATVGGTFVSIGSMSIEAADQNNDRLRFHNVGSGSDWSLVGGVPALSNTGMCLYDNNAAACRLRLADSTGNIGIGTLTPTTLLDVVGNAQFGAGVLKSTFNATPSATVYALDLSSGVRVNNGGEVKLSAGARITWPDGSVSTSAFTTPGNSVFQSSYTLNGWTQTGLPTSYGVAAASVTITTVGNRPIRVVFEVSAVDDSNSRTVCGVVMVDGAYFGPYGPTTSMDCDRRVTTGTTNPQKLKFEKTFPASQAPAAGTRTWGLYLKTDAGSVSSPNVTAGFDAINVFGVEEN